MRVTEFLFVSSFVDVLIITGNDAHAISWFKLQLISCFHMKDLDFLKYFLGIAVSGMHSIYI